jgi:hypothetical protein
LDPLWLPHEVRSCRGQSSLPCRRGQTLTLSLFPPHGQSPAGGHHPPGLPLPKYLAGAVELRLSGVVSGLSGVDQRSGVGDVVRILLGTGRNFQRRTAWGIKGQDGRRPPARRQPPLKWPYSLSRKKADAEWIVIRRPLRGHNDTSFGRSTPGWTIGRPGVGHPHGVFGVFCYY